MLLSHTQKFIYFHIPKTGGSSMSWQLQSLLETPGPLPTEEELDSGWQDKLHFDGRQHSSYKTNRKICMSHPDYYKFAFVRNPWDLTLSWYTSLSRSWSNEHLDVDNFSKEGMKNFLRLYLFPQSISDWWNHFVKLNKGYRKLVSTPQGTYITDENGCSQLDFIARFESYEKDSRFLFQRFGLNVDEEVQINRSRHGKLDYRDFYDDESRKLIADRFRNDIELFGYEF